MSAHVHLFGCKTGVPGGRGPCPGCRGCAAAEGQVVGGRNPIGAAGCSGALGGAGSAPSHQEQLWLLSPALMCIPVQGRAPGGSAHHPPLPDCQSEPWHIPKEAPGWWQRRSRRSLISQGQEMAKRVQCQPSEHLPVPRLCLETTALQPCSMCSGPNVVGASQDARLLGEALLYPTLTAPKLLPHPA